MSRTCFAIINGAVQWSSQTTSRKSAGKKDWKKGVSRNHCGHGLLVPVALAMLFSLPATSSLLFSGLPLVG